MTVFLFLVIFTILSILFNTFLAFVLFLGTSASFCRFSMVSSRSSLMLRVPKLNISVSSSEAESWASILFAWLFCFITYFTAFSKRAFRSWPSASRFLAPWYRTQPALLPRSVDQVDFMDLGCACITFYKFISCPGPWIGHTVRFLSLFLLSVFILASSSEGFTAWYGALICTDLVYWWISPDWLVSCFDVLLHFAYENFPLQFLVTHKTQQSMRVIGLRGQTLVWQGPAQEALFFYTPSHLSELQICK